MALTFDDGPDPRGTPLVLDALAEAGLTATFFVLGTQVERHPDLLRRVLDGGHRVEVHGHGHPRHPESPRDLVADDIDRALAALERAGVTPARWRIPWGHLADYTPDLAAERDLQIVGWTIDTHDWRGDRADGMLDAIKLEPGAIVLAHDGIGAGARRNDARETAALIGPLAARARAHGLRPGPLECAWPVPVPLGNPDFG